MAYQKYEAKGVGSYSAVVTFTALAAGPLAFLTTGLLGKITFFALRKFGSWLANQGLAIANIGFDYVNIPLEKEEYDQVMDAAIKQILSIKRKLTKEEKDAIDEPVREAFRRFGSFV